jgi:type VI secretion system secreted protein Hcp
MPASLFLKLEAIPGQSEVDGHAKEIECLSFNQSVSQRATESVSNQARTTGRPNHSDFSVTKYLDESSPKILEHCNKGEDVKTATFTVTQADGTTGKVAPLWVITMSKALITSVSIGGGGGDIPIESLTLNYTAIKWEFKAQTSAAEKKGTAASGWDLEANKAAAAGKA